MRRESITELIALRAFKGLIAAGIILLLAVFLVSGASAKADNSSEIKSEDQTFEKLNPDRVTTEWNDAYLFSSREDTLKELESLKKRSEEINETFRPEFENLSGPVLFDYLDADKEFSKSLEVLYVYAYTQLSKNVSDPFFASLLTDSQNLVTEYGKATSFAGVKLTSLNKEDWDRLFSEEPELEKYRLYLEARYNEVCRAQANERVPGCLSCRSR